MRKEKLMADNLVRQVVDLLTAASSNPLDGGVSDTLCQAIYTAWQAKSNGKNKGKMLEACLLYTSQAGPVRAGRLHAHGAQRPRGEGHE